MQIRKATQEGALRSLKAMLQLVAGEAQSEMSCQKSTPCLQQH